MSQTPSTSPTPILDFEQPLPTPDDRRVTGRFALPFLLFVTFLCWIDNAEFLIAPVGILLIGFLTTLVHEAGHVIAGLLVGLNFDGVVVGPIAIRRHHDGWHIRFRPRIASGLTYMSPKEIRRIRRRVVIGVAGGPISSLICGVVAIVSGEVARAYYDSPWPTFFEFFGIFSLSIGVIAFLPHYSGPFAGDGTLLRVLLGRLPGARQLIAIYALSVLHKKNPNCPSLHPRWLKLAYSGGILVPRYHLSWYKFSTASDSSLAASSLEECLENSSFLDPTERDALMAEAVIFSAWQRANASAAQKWLSRIQYPNRLPELTRLKMNTAVARASGQLNVALQYCDSAFEIVEKQCAGPGAKEFLAFWQDWKTEIEKRGITAGEKVEAIP